MPPAVDAALVDGPVDEHGYSIVGGDVFPPLYQRVVAKPCPSDALHNGECLTDEDCGQGSACVCGSQPGRAAWNQCLPAECRAMADCPGGRCLLSLGTTCCGNGHTGLVCSRAASGCSSGEDCAGNGIACLYDTTLDRFECRPFGCNCSQ
jgi:hypothetical protein